MIYSLIVLTAGFFVLVKGADWFVDGASSLASIFHVSQLVIGLTICAMGTSLPEAAVSLVAGLKGNSLYVAFKSCFTCYGKKSTSCIVSRRTYFNRYVYRLFTLFVLAVTKRK